MLVVEREVGDVDGAGRLDHERDEPVDAPRVVHDGATLVHRDEALAALIRAETNHRLGRQHNRSRQLGSVARRDSS